MCTNTGHNPQDVGVDPEFCFKVKYSFKETDKVWSSKEKKHINLEK